MAKAPDHRVLTLAAIADRMLGDMAGHKTAERLHGEVMRLHAGAEALGAASAVRSPLETPEAHMKRIAGMAKKYDREITPMLNRAAATMQEGLKDIERRIGFKVDLRPSAFAEEIRAMFRTLDSKAKTDLLNELVDSNRGPELAAIIKAPAILTGIPDDRRAMYEQIIVTKHAPAEFAEKEKLEEIFSAVMTAQSVAEKFAKSMVDPAKLGEIERGEAEVAAAGAAFEQSLQ